MAARIARHYSDLNLAFKPHPVTGDITKLKDTDAIKRAIRNLILTDHYERPWQPTIGSGVTQMLFENISIVTKHKVKTAVEDVIRNYESRAKLLDVTVQISPDQNKMLVSVFFETVNATDPVKVDVILERRR